MQLKEKTRQKIVEIGDDFCLKFGINQYELFRRKSIQAVCQYLFEYLFDGTGTYRKLTSETLNMYKSIHKLYTIQYNYSIQNIYWHTIEYFLCIYWLIKRKKTINSVIYKRFKKLMQYKVIGVSSNSLQDALEGTSRYIAKPLTEKQIKKINIGDLNNVKEKKKMQFKFEAALNSKRNSKQSSEIHRNIPEKRKRITSLSKKSSKKNLQKRFFSGIRLKKIE